jgi:hypothetical protein
MKNFNADAAQGEITLRKITVLPNGLETRVGATNGRIIVGHSETGHHHTLDERCVEVYEASTAPAGMRILYAIVNSATTLDHERPHDTHESVGLQPGMYEFRIGREYDPYAEIARQQAD